jgi:MSHA pilin protein MshA
MQSITKQKQSGFTLVELIVVIVILGILAATALPKFINVSADAKRSTIEALTGALRSSVTLAQAKYYATGDAAATTVELQDGTLPTVHAGVGIASGIPTGDAAGITAMLQGTDGYVVTYAGTVATFRTESGPLATCQVTYDGGDGSVAPAITMDVSTC